MRAGVIINSRKALFLDRDGIINIDHGYVYKITEFDFVEGIFDLCREAVRLGYLLIVVTNQSGIGRGYFTEDDFRLLTSWMTKCFEDKGLNIAAVYYSADIPLTSESRQERVLSRRKPSAAMLFEAEEEHKVELIRSVMIGDKDSDIEAAFRARVPTRIRLLSKYAVGHDNKATHIIENLNEARLILKEISS